MEEALTTTNNDIEQALRGHYVKFLGSEFNERRLAFMDYRVSVLRWSAETNPTQVTVYATIGGSLHPIPAAPDHRLEVYSGFLPDPDGTEEFSRTLAEIAMHQATEGSEVHPGHTFTFAESLWPGAAMRTILLASPGPQPSVPPLDLANGVHVEFLLAIPIHDREAQEVRRIGVDALLELWAEEEVPFWDPHREAAAQAK